MKIFKWNYSIFLNKFRTLSKKMLGASILYFSFKIANRKNSLNLLESKYNYSHLPTYNRKDVSQHYNYETRIWVIFRDGVYDITDFVNVHPGGSDKILMAAGGYLDVFWAMYSFHLTSDFVFEILHKYRIGNLNANDVLKESEIPNFSKLKKETANDRSKKLIKHHSFPYCAESPQSQLINHFYTPNDLFFVRNHNSIPEEVNLEDYKLEIELPNSDEHFEYNFIDLLNNIKSTKKSTLLACSGLRRKHFGPTVKGIHWKSGAIGNGIWEGISIKDLFSYIGINFKNEEIENLHFQCYGLDKDFQGENYNVSIPLKEALEQGILANRYNHENIPFDHGYPVRFIIPGFIGVRNVKWLKKIKISNQEAQGSFQQKDYKIFPSNTDISKVDLSKINPVMTWEVSSSICSPDEEIEIDHKDKILNLKGWAFGTKGNEIFKIELSFDNGISWIQIPNKDLRFDTNDDGKVFGWTTWKYKICEEELKQHIIKGNLNTWVRATDLKGNTQPNSSEEIINFRGLMNNSIHKVNFKFI